MKLQKNRKLAATTLILILAIVATTAALIPAAQALDIPTYSLLSVEPNPVGVNQRVYVNAFMSKPTPTAGMAGSGDQYENIRIQIVRPDGRNDTIGPLKSDSTGGTWASYVPSQVGTYTFQMFYPGGVLAGGGNVFMGGGFNWTGSKLLPSKSDPISLVVQSEPIVPIYNSPPLPTEYWSRPIYSTNYAWSDMASNWLGLAAPAFASTGQLDATGNFQEYGKAPNTGHIVWTKPTHFGGQVGAPISADQMSQYTSTSIAINYFEPMIMNGILFYTRFASVTSEIVGWEAIDLHTGETLWTRTAGETGKEVIRMGQILRFHTVQEYGSVAYIWSTEVAGFFQNPTFYGLYDAMTGDWVANVTGIQNGAFLVDYTGEQQGTLLRYYTNATHLILWNSTKCLTSGFSPFGPIVVTIRPTGTYSWDSGIQWAVPIPTKIGNADISPALGIGATTPEVILLRGYASPGMFQELGYGYQTTAGIDAKTGQLLWGPINQTLPYLQDMALLAARNGYYVMHNKDTDEAYGYSLTNGQQLWGPVQLPGNAWSHISRAGAIAYGNVYIWDFGGYMSALDLKSGQIKWTFFRGDAGYDTPFGIYTLWHFGTHSIADGKIFLAEGHMYDPPLFPNAQRLALNATTGEIVWSLMSFAGRCPGAIADSMLLQWNSYDAQIYTIGKGQTATSVAVSPKVSTKGSEVLIEGMVTDQSPGTKNADRVARFPDGVPAISDANMSVWMEYVYMQQPKPKDVTGVPVHLIATDPNGNLQDIGTVTSDIDGNYAMSWTPPVPGLYKIIASFEGSESYFVSYAVTNFVVSEAPAASVQPTIAPVVTPTPVLPTPTPVTPVPSASPTQPAPPEAGPNTALYVAIAAVIVIALIAAIALVLRRRK